MSHSERQIVILGAGTAGTMMANRLVHKLPPGWRVVLLDQDDVHLYQPGLLFLPFGMYREEEITKPRRRLLDPRVQLRLQGIERVDAGQNRVYLKDGESVGYEYLIVATGSRITPEATPGLVDEGWRKTAFDFYTLDGARALRGALDRFTGGRLVVNIVELPIKCPVAPLEFIFLAEAELRRRGLRDKTELVYATPLEGAFTKPVASAMLGDLLSRRGISVVGDFACSEVDGAKRLLKSYDGRELPYDLLVSIPLHAGAEVISRSKLGDASGWVPTHRNTLAALDHKNVFVLGDATDLPSSKAGAVAHFQADVLAANLVDRVYEREPRESFDGHANCFIETGDGQAMLIDFNYDTEPLPGKFPVPGVGPFTLLGESAVNHWGKLAFKWMYWNLLLPGKELPITHRMQAAGKQGAAREPANVQRRA